MGASQVTTLISCPVIPAVRTLDDFEYALAYSLSPGIILLFGDISMLAGLLGRARQYAKRLLVHLDLLEGIGKDKAGVRFLAKLGVTAMITTKSHLAKVAKEEGMIVIQRLFLMDSEALRNGIGTMRNFKPDAVEVLPASVPAAVIRQLMLETGLPVLAGGLMHTAADVRNSLASGACAVSCSNRELWRGAIEGAG